MEQPTGGDRCRPLRPVTEVTVPAPPGLEVVVGYSIPPAVSGSAFWRVSMRTLLTRTKIRNSTNPMRSRTSPNAKEPRPIGIPAQQVIQLGQVDQKHGGIDDG
jgi:hypothetical protein